jgi:hypothetical protein
VPRLVQNIILTRLLFLFTDVICLFADNVGGFNPQKLRLPRAIIEAIFTLPRAITEAIFISYPCNYSERGCLEDYRICGCVWRLRWALGGVGGRVGRSSAICSSSHDLNDRLVNTACDLRSHLLL